MLDAATPLRLDHEVDPARLRAHDVPEIRGSASLLEGWEPEIPLEQTLADAARVVADRALGDCPACGAAALVPWRSVPAGEPSDPSRFRWRAAAPAGQR